MAVSSIHRLSRAPHAAVNVVCFPHAGGSLATFRSWDMVVPDMIVWVAKYPGRADRIHEPYADCIEALAHSIAASILDQIDGPLLLFGHSMGAAVAFETVRELERCGVCPVALFVSGARHGRLPPESDGGEVLTDDDLIAQLKEMGGLDGSLLATPEFREIVLPYIRSDGAIFRQYVLRETPRLSCPIIAIVGDSDIHACVLPWADLTEAAFTEHVVPGGHFYLQSDPPGTWIQSYWDAHLNIANTLQSEDLARGQFS